MSEFSIRRARPDELKPCPFCGSGDIANVSAGHAGPTDIWHVGYEIFAVNCKDCGASVPNRYSNDLVVEAWNCRAALAQQAEPVEEQVMTPITQRDALLKVLKTIKDTKRLAREMQQDWCPAAEGMVRMASAAIKTVEGEILLNGLTKSETMETASITGLVSKSG